MSAGAAAAFAVLPEPTVEGPAAVGTACEVEGASCVATGAAATGTGATGGFATRGCAGAAARVTGVRFGTSDCCLTTFLMTGGGGGGGGGLAALTNRICITGVRCAGFGAGTCIDVTPAINAPSIARAARIAMVIALPERGCKASIDHIVVRDFSDILMFIPLDSRGY
ncbi:hypothetical protein [Paraburkholderia sp. 40]|uniref:hypothetical protein n=1 Tax=unclassified Paraburkholderia TaxID=2615204 RepID=UPI003D1B070C